MAYGSQGHVGISFQESFGTSYPNSRDYFPVITESLTEEIPPLISEGIKSRFEEGGIYEGAHAISGDITTEIHPIGMGKLLKAWSGASSSTETNVGSSVYQHAFVPHTSDFDAMAAVPPMSIEVYRDAGSAFLYYDMLANGLSIEVAHGMLLKTTVSFVGGKFSKLAKTTPSYPAGSYFPWNVTSVSLGGTAIDEVSQLTFNWSNALEAKNTLDGTKTPNRIKRNGFRTLEISGTLLFVNQTEVDNFLNQTRQRLIVTATGQDVGGENAVLKIDVPKMNYSAFPVNIGGAGLIEVGFSAKAEFDETSNYLSEITLINTEAAY